DEADQPAEQLGGVDRGPDAQLGDADRSVRVDAHQTQLVEARRIALVRVHGDPVEDLYQVVPREILAQSVEDDVRDEALDRVHLVHVRGGRDVQDVPCPLHRIVDL